MLITEPEFREIDPAKKNAEWGDKIISRLRLLWEPVVDPKAAKTEMEYLFSQQKEDMDKIKAQFAESDFKKNTDFEPIAVLEKIRNIIISEITSSHTRVEIDALDPTAITEREADKKLLQNRKLIESTLSNVNSGIGLPAYKVPYDKFNGNIEEFDDMGLDSEDPNDINFFFKTFFKLRHEAHAQLTVNSVMEVNRFDDMLDDLVNDILAKKACVFQAYVHKVNGGIKYRYIAPENARAVMGKKPDSTDSPCVGWEDSLTIEQVISYVGNNFDWERDWQYLLSAANFSSHQQYTGIFYNGATYGNDRTVVSYNTLMGMTVGFGYIEFITVNADAYKVKNDRSLIFRTDINYQPEEKASYSKEVYYGEQTLGAYFITTGASSQRLFGFGPVYHQLLEGAEDEYSRHTIKIIREKGKTATQIVKPFIKIALSAFYKMLWAIYHSRPDMDWYNVDNIVSIAQFLQKEEKKIAGIDNGDGRRKVVEPKLQNQILEIIKLYQTNLVGLYTNNTIDGKQTGGDVFPHKKEKRGIDPIAIAMQTVVDWAEGKAADRLGINDLRQGMTNPKDGMRLGLEATNQSRNATGYVPRMILKLMQHTAVTTCLYAQDIVKFKDTRPYNYLKNLIGDRAIKSFQDLENIAMHRYGIFVKTFNTDQERKQQEADARQAHANKEITYEQLLLINSIEDYKKAGMILAYYKDKNYKRTQQEIQVAQKNAMDLENLKHANELKRITTKQNGEIRQEQVRGYWYFLAHKNAGDSKIITTEMKIDAEPGKQDAKKETSIEVAKAKEEIKNTGTTTPQVTLDNREKKDAASLIQPPPTDVQIPPVETVPPVQITPDQQTQPATSEVAATADQ